MSTGRCLSLIVVATLAGCGGDDKSAASDLEPITSAQAEKFTDKFLETGCDKLAACLMEDLEDQGAEPDEDMQDDLKDQCISDGKAATKKEIEACKRWDKDLAKSCLKDIEPADCPPKGGTLEVESCEQLLEQCKMEDEDESEDEDKDKDKDSKKKDSGKKDSKKKDESEEDDYRAFARLMSI